MATFVLEDSDNLTKILSLNLPKEDYEPLIKKELNKIRKKAQIKGFRQGQVPISYVRKMYGNNILFEQINKMINDELTSFITDSDVHYLGQPLPVEGAFPTLDINKLDDYTFKFELGYAPELELKGLDGDLTATLYTIEVAEEDLDKEVTNWRKQFGKREKAETVVEDDILTVAVKEMANGELKEGGLEAEIKVAVDMVKDEALQQQFLAAKAGDKLTINIWGVEDRSQDYIKKNILGIEADVEINDEFEATIEEVMHFELAAPSKFLFRNSFGEESYKEFLGEDLPEEPETDEDGEVVEPAPPSAEEQAEVLEAVRKRITKEIAANYEKSAKGQYYFEIRQALQEANGFDLPENFLKKWHESQGDQQEMTDEEFVKFSKDLKWTLIETKLANHYDVKVEYDEIEANVQESIRGYYGGYVPEEQVTKLTKMIMENQEQVEKRFRQMMAERIFARLEEAVAPVEASITRKDFEKLVEESQK